MILKKTFVLAFVRSPVENRETRSRVVNLSGGERPSYSDRQVPIPWACKGAVSAAYSTITVCKTTRSPSGDPASSTTGTRSIVSGRYSPTSSQC